MEKILVGLSGGVDSAIAAYLLKEQGYDVSAAFMRNWDSLTNNDILGNPTLMEEICSQEQDYLDARAVAEKLQIPLFRIDFIQEYWDKVFSTFLEEYQKGRTPNPDILCNEFIKFDSFYHYAKKQGFDRIATGHYAGNEPEKGIFLKKAADQNKDQSYFLAQAPAGALKETLFPLAELTKGEIRALAEKLELESVAHKKDSTGICFIGERHFKEFLSNYLPATPGKIIDINTGKTVGEHAGVFYYTIGQRKGLNISHYAGPWFVVGKDVRANELYVTHHTNKDLLISNGAKITDIHWLKKPEKIPITLQAKFRYRQPDQKVTIERLADEGKTALLSFDQGIEAISPGQECVFYQGEICLGGGKIEAVYKDGRELGEILKEKRAGHV